MAKQSKCGVIDFLTVTATAAVSQGDVLIFGPYFGMACNDAAIGDDLTLDIVPYKAITDSSAVSGVAAAIGDAVYFNPTTKAYSDASAAGYALVGYTTRVKSSNNDFEYEKVRYATVAE